MCLHNPLAVYVPAVLRLIDLGLRDAWTLLFYSLPPLPSLLTSPHYTKKRTAAISLDGYTLTSPIKTETLLKMMNK